MQARWLRTLISSRCRKLCCFICFKNLVYLWVVFCFEYKWENNLQNIFRYAHGSKRQWKVIEDLKNWLFVKILAHLVPLASFLLILLSILEIVAFVYHYLLKQGRVPCFYLLGASNVGTWYDTWLMTWNLSFMHTLFELPNNWGLEAYLYCAFTFIK